MFKHGKHKFKGDEHKFTDRKHKFTACKHKILKVQKYINREGNKYVYDRKLYIDIQDISYGYESPDYFCDRSVISVCGDLLSLSTP
jgi:hypothetical protein